MLGSPAYGVIQLFEVGEVLAGKYRVERVLGQGGMGVVLAARHLHLDEPVAVKLMLEDTASNPEAAARFVREARAAARLQSMHVARVSDVGVLDDGRAYMVMEYLDGSDLAEVLQKNGPLAVGDAVDYVLQAGEAIAEAHSLGIVHRDLKPSNLFLTRRRDRTPHIKVLDFGISKAVTPGVTSNMTQTSAMIGSPLYMSPEQMTSARDVDGRADIWALGVVMYELLTGSLPFSGETLPQICARVLQEDAPRLCAQRGDVPPELDAVVRRCLAKQPGDRFQDVAELAVALRGLAGPYGRSSVERILLLAGDETAQRISNEHALTLGDAAAQTGPELGKGTHAAWGDARASVPRRRSALWFAVPAGLVAVLGVGAWFARAKPEVIATPDATPSSVSAAPSLAVTPTPTAAELEPARPVMVAPSPAIAPTPGEAPAAVTVSVPKKNATRGSSSKPAPKPTPVAAKPVAHDVVAPASPLPSPPAVAAKTPIGLGGRL